MTYFFAITKDIFKIYFKSLVFSKQNAVVLRFDIVSDKSFSVTPVFTALILLPLFQIIKTPQCCGFLLIFYFSLWPPILHLCVSEVECYMKNDEK